MREGGRTRKMIKRTEANKCEQGGNGRYGLDLRAIKVLVVCRDFAQDNLQQLVVFKEVFAPRAKRFPFIALSFYFIALSYAFAYGGAKTNPQNKQRSYDRHIFTKN